MVLSRPRAFFSFFFFHSPHSLCPARWNGHQTPQATKWGGERRAGDPQQEEGAGPPLRHHRRPVLAGAPGHPGGRRLLVASLPLQVEKHWTGGRTSVWLSRKTRLPPLALVRNFCDSWQLTQCCLSRNTFVFFLFNYHVLWLSPCNRVFSCFRYIMVPMLCKGRQVLWRSCCRGEVMSTVKFHPLRHSAPSCPTYSKVAHPEIDPHLISWMAFILRPSYHLSMFYVSLLALVLLCQICFCMYKLSRHVNNHVCRLLFCLVLPMWPAMHWATLTQQQ